MEKAISPYEEENIGIEVNHSIIEEEIRFLKRRGESKKNKIKLSKSRILKTLCYVIGD